MKQDKVLQVCYEDQTVGTLAMTADHKVAFQYSDEWLESMTIDFSDCLSSSFSAIRRFIPFTSKKENGQFLAFF